MRTSFYSKIHITKKEENKEKISNLDSHLIHKRHGNARTRVFWFRKCWTLEIVIERHLMKYPVHEYMSDTYEERDFRLYSRRREDKLAAGEKRKYRPPTVLGNGVYRVDVDPKPRRIRPRLRSRLQKKGHFGPLTDVFTGEEDRQISSERIWLPSPWQEILESGEPTTATDIESRRDELWIFRGGSTRSLVLEVRFRRNTARRLTNNRHFSQPTVPTGYLWHFLPYNFRSKQRMS